MNFKIFDSFNYHIKGSLQVLLRSPNMWTLKIPRQIKDVRLKIHRIFKLTRRIDGHTNIDTKSLEAYPLLSDFINSLLFWPHLVHVVVLSLSLFSSSLCSWSYFMIVHCSQTSSREAVSTKMVNHCKKSNFSITGDLI